MPNLAALLREEISKIARKEVQDQVRELMKTVREQRDALARLEKRIGPAKAKAAAKPAAAQPAAKVSEAPAGAKEKQIRISPDTILKHRKRLKLSQAELGKLLNVSTNTVLRWEAGKSKPRGKHLPGLDQLRSISLREVKKLGSAKADAQPADAQPADAKSTDAQPTDEVSEAPAGAKEKQIRISPDAILKHRKRLKLSQAELGKLLNVSTNTVLRWEAGKSKPRGKHLPGLDQLRSTSLREVKEQLGE